jgi:PAS domain S-box-containing protein
VNLKPTHINSKQEESSYNKDLILERLLALFNNSTSGMAICSLEGQYLSVNEQFSKICGYSEKELLNMTIKELTHPDDIDSEQKQLAELFAGKRKSFQMEKRYITKAKQIIWVNIMISIVLDDDNNPDVIIGTVEDITDKKKTFEELEKSKTDYKSALKLLQSIQDAIPDVIGVQDKHHRMIQYNRAGYEMLNKTHKEIVGKKCYELIGRKEQCEVCSTAEAIKTKKRAGHVQYFPEMDTWLDTRSYPIFNDDGEIIYIVEHLRDITDYKKLELELKNTNKELTNHKNNLELLVKERTLDLEEANIQLKEINEEIKTKNAIINERNEELNQTLTNLKETQAQLFQTEKMATLGTLTAGVAHEINNPLNYLMGSYVGLIRYFEENKSVNKEKTDLLLESIKVGIERITNITKSLNQFSRSNEALDETCDINSILDNCFEMLQNKIKGNIKVNKAYAKTPVLVKGNVGKLHQAFLNIITNAVQAIIENGNVDATTEINVRKAIITISDNGEGIDKENINRITDPFFTTKSPGEGTGLGLSITEAIIREHSGKIIFDSKVNKGTNVIITLPLQEK